MNALPPNIRAVIVGASDGIGHAVCAQLADLGGEAFLIGPSEEKLRELSKIYGWGYAVADGSNWAQLDGVLSCVDGILGEINAAINLAGSMLLKPMQFTKREEWLSRFRSNLTSAAGIVQSCVPRMLATGGSIVLMDPARVLRLSDQNLIGPGETKMEDIVREASKACATKNIRVNAIAPGLSISLSNESRPAIPSTEDFSHAKKSICYFESLEDVARTILWLASPERSWLTGQTIGVGQWQNYSLDIGQKSRQVLHLPAEACPEGR